jgi:hypothetical protein
MSPGNPDDENPDDFDGVEWAARLLGPDFSDQLAEESEKIEREEMYTKDWEYVSYQFRESKAFICESCGVDLSKHKGLLHVHHMDQNRENNDPRNLIALCVLCHCERHFHMTADIIGTQIIEELRQKRIDIAK